MDHLFTKANPKLYLGVIFSQLAASVCSCVRLGTFMLHERERWFFSFWFVKQFVLMKEMKGTLMAGFYGAFQMALKKLLNVIPGPGM